MGMFTIARFRSSILGALPWTCIQQQHNRRNNFTKESHLRLGSSNNYKDWHQRPVSLILGEKLTTLKNVRTQTGISLFPSTLVGIEDNQSGKEDYFDSFKFMALKFAALSFQQNSRIQMIFSPSSTPSYVLPSMPELIRYRFKKIELENQVDVTTCKVMWNPFKAKNDDFCWFPCIYLLILRHNDGGWTVSHMGGNYGFQVVSHSHTHEYLRQVWKKIRAFVKSY